jgi:hypothetical protein
MTPRDELLLLLLLLLHLKQRGRGTLPGKSVWIHVSM